MEIKRRHVVSEDAIAHAVAIRDCLNELVELDVSALNKLFSVSVSCNYRVADHPRVVANQIMTESCEPHYTISPLGVINSFIDENLAIVFGGQRFRVAVRDSHPDDIQFVDECV